MRRPSRIRHVLKWGGLVLSIVIIVAWVASFRWSVFYGVRGSERYIGILIGAGRIQFETISNEQIEKISNEQIHFAEWETPSGLYFYETSVSAIWLFRVGHDRWGTLEFILPLWIPFLLVAIPTGFLFWRDHRKVPQGHCKKCRYDLTGNTSGVCPECGERI